MFFWCRLVRVNSFVCIFGLCLFQPYCVFPFSPPARWGSLDFILVLVVFSSSSSSSSSSCSPFSFSFSSGSLGSPLRVLDVSGQCRTSTGSARSHDFNCGHQISVGTAGPEPRTPVLSGHCGNQTRTPVSGWGLLEESKFILAVSIVCNTCFPSAVPTYHYCKVMVQRSAKKMNGSDTNRYCNLQRL